MTLSRALVERSTSGFRTGARSGDEERGMSGHDDTDRTRYDRRRFLGLTGAAGLATFAGGVLAACGSGESGVGAASTGSTKIGLSMETFTVPRWKFLDKPNFERAVRAAGFTPEVTQANFEVDRQLSDVQNLLSEGLAALAIIAVVAEAGVNMVRRASREDVPVLAYNTAIPSKDVAAFVARDNRGVGRKAAEDAGALLGGFTGRWVIASGEAGNAVAVEMTQGYMDVLQPHIDAGELEVVSQLFHRGWDPDLARRQAEDALTKHRNDIRAFLCNNDGMAGGAITALAEQRLAGRVVVTGQDATTEACRAIVKGEQAFSSFTRFDRMGTTGGELAVKLARGETVTSRQSYAVPGGSIPFFPIESYNVDRDNLVEYLREYSPEYVDPEAVFKDIPRSELPAGAEELVA
jgi:D-xylose transport system substrate-binding protein